MEFTVLEHGWIFPWRTVSHNQMVPPGLGPHQGLDVPAAHLRFPGHHEAAAHRRKEVQSGGWPGGPRKILGIPGIPGELRVGTRGNDPFGKP